MSSALDILLLGAFIFECAGNPGLLGMGYLMFSSHKVTKASLEANNTTKLDQSEEQRKEASANHASHDAPKSLKWTGLDDTSNAYDTPWGRDRARNGPEG